MARINVDGLDIFLGDLRKMSQEVRNINKGALGEGAKVAADRMRETLEMLPIRPDKYTGDQHTEPFYGVTEDEYIQILDNFGIARFKNSSGGWNTSIGFKGTVNTPSPKYGNQVPTGMLVQAVEYGTDFRKAWHGLGNAQKSLKTEVESAIQKYIDDKTKEIMQ